MLDPAASWPSEATLGPAEAWALAAWQSLDRGDAWSAFLDWRRAQSIDRAHPEAGRWRLGEARALLELERPAEAAVIVGTLMAGPPDLARPSEALLGTIEARLGHLASAVGHLESSLRNDDSWTGAGRAMADLAVTQMMAGRDGEALELTTRAAQRLERDSDWVGLATLLANERVWAAHRGLGEVEAAVRDRLARLATEKGVVAD